MSSYVATRFFTDESVSHPICDRLYDLLYEDIFDDVRQEVLGDIDGLRKNGGDKMGNLVQLKEMLVNRIGTCYSLLCGRLEVIDLYFSIPHHTFSNYFLNDPNVADKYKRAFREKITKEWTGIDDIINYEMDMTYDIFAISTFNRQYASRDVQYDSSNIVPVGIDQKHSEINLSEFTDQNVDLTHRKAVHIIDTPQFMFLRVVIGIMILSDPTFEEVKEIYNLLSSKKLSLASPTLFNSAHRREQLSSCFLIEIEDDSMDGIMETMKDMAMISKFAGGIGCSIHKVRTKGSTIRGTGGHSDGVMTMLNVAAAVANYSNQGGGRRKGSFAIYAGMHNPEIRDLCRMRQNSTLVKDLFNACWISDLFMERVMNDKPWLLIDPGVHGNVEDLWGEEYEQRIEELEILYYNGMNNGEKPSGLWVVNARDIMSEMVRCITELGTPYVCFKDHANYLSNIKVKTLDTSNLCSEIMQPTGVPDDILKKFPNDKAEQEKHRETAVCNLASICLPRFVVDGKVDFEGLRSLAYTTVELLNNVIDINYYPTPSAKRSNMRHRPMGIGIQGLQDMFILLGLPFESDEAIALSAKVAEYIYLGAVESSINLARKYGKHDSYEFTDAHHGMLHFDAYKNLQDDLLKKFGENPSFQKFRKGIDCEIKFTLHDEWKRVKAALEKYGRRNGLLIAYMPTASTSQFSGNYEGMEPQYGNIMTRRTLSGDFMVVNKYLYKLLKERGGWNGAVVEQILKDQGSVRNIRNLTDKEKLVFKTVFEVKMKDVLRHSIARAPFVDQSMSQNAYTEDPSVGKIFTYLMVAWAAGLKTGLYYLRWQMRVESKSYHSQEKIKDKPKACPYKPGMKPEDCLSCGA